MITNANLAGNYRLWPRSDTEALLRLTAERVPRAELAERFGRSFKAIKKKLAYERERGL